MKNSPKIHELSHMPSPSIHALANPAIQSVVNSRRHGYKGGRRLACGVRFQFWRTTEGLSQLEVARDMIAYARESTIKALGAEHVADFDERYMLDRIQEMEYGRFKPAPWLVLLFIQTYTPQKAALKVPGPKFPWWEFWDGQKK